jgi:hypothetical protein
MGDRPFLLQAEIWKRQSVIVGLLEESYNTPDVHDKPSGAHAGTVPNASVPVSLVLE